LEANWVAGVLKAGVNGEVLGEPKGEVVRKGDPLLSAAMFPPLICKVGPPNGVVGDGFGIEGVDEVNENTALGVGLKSEVAGPVFGKPNEDGTDVVNWLPNIGDVDDAELDTKPELVAEYGGAVAATEVKPEPGAQGNTELALKGLEHKGAKSTCESAKLCELPLFDICEDLKLKLFTELCMNSELLFPEWPF